MRKPRAPFLVALYAATVVSLTCVVANALPGGLGYPANMSLDGIAPRSTSPLYTAIYRQGDLAGTSRMRIDPQSGAGHGFLIDDANMSFGSGFLFDAVTPTGLHLESGALVCSNANTTGTQDMEVGCTKANCVTYLSAGSAGGAKTRYLALTNGSASGQNGMNQFTGNTASIFGGNGGTTVTGAAASTISIGDNGGTQPGDVNITVGGVTELDVTGGIPNLPAGFKVSGRNTAAQLYWPWTMHFGQTCAATTCDNSGSTLPSGTTGLRLNGCAFTPHTIGVNAVTCTFGLWDATAASFVWSSTYTCNSALGRIDVANTSALTATHVYDFRQTAAATGTAALGDLICWVGY